MTRANRSGALELLEVASTQHVVGDRAGRGPVPAALRALGSDGRRGHVVAVLRGHYPGQPPYRAFAHLQREVAAHGPTPQSGGNFRSC